MRLRDLECYLRVCETGSINRAAVDLRIAQPALGLLIRKLEADFEVDLFTRHSRGVTITREGEKVAAWAREVLESHRRIQECFQLTRSLPHHLRLGLSPSAAALLAINMPAATQRFMPGVTVQLLEDSSHVLIDHVAASELDLALTFETASRTILLSEPLLHQSLYLVARAGEFGAHQTIPFARALDRALVMTARPASVRYVVETEGAKIDRAPNIAHELKSLSLLKDFVSQGIGCAILPLSCVSEDLLAGRLSAARIIEPELRRTLSLVHRADRADVWATVDGSIAACIRSTLPKFLPEGITAH